MGSPILSLVAELVQQDMEDIVKIKFFKIQFYFCYMDETLICVQKDDFFQILDDFKHKQMEQ